MSPISNLLLAYCIPVSCVKVICLAPKLKLQFDTDTLLLFTLNLCDPPVTTLNESADWNCI